MPVVVPESLESAIAVLTAHPSSTVLAGGTDLMVEVNDGRRALERVVAVGRVPELAGIRVDAAKVVIGAATTFAQLELDPVARLVPALAYAARTVGSPQIRNAATIGGNLATASPAGDALPVLVALGASVEIAGNDGRRLIPIAEFFTGPKRSVLGTGDLVVAVHVPVRRGPQDYLKVGVRNAMVIAVCSFALALDLEKHQVGTGIGSAGPTPLRAVEAEDFIQGELDWENRSAPSEAALRRFGELAAAAAKPIDDVRGTAAYRRHALAVMARRCLSWTWAAAA